MFNSITVRIVALIVVVFLAFTLRQFTASAPDINAGHAFNTERAFSRLAKLLGDESPHPVDSASNDLVRKRLLHEIRTLGFIPIVRDDFHCSEYGGSMRCAQVKNILFWVGEPGSNAVMIASHYDSVPAGPGAADDGAGVAASLEIAFVLKEQNLGRPLLILITDGEEIGLVGAAAFVDKDPVAKLVSAVVSMEARGVSGPVAMFQTSTPNGRDVSALKSDIKMASTSSLAADVYEKMPNGTDVTQFLTLDVDVGNFAIGGSPEFYHTPRDNLNMLDKRSFFHMGVSALNTTQAYLQQSGSEAEQQWIYSDILGLLVIAIPQIFSLPLILISGVLLVAVFVVKGSGPPIKAIAFPFLAIFLGAGFAVATSFGVDALRPEAHYAAAHPWALRAAQNSAALLGALIALMVLGRSVNSLRLLSSAWICMAILGGVLSYMVAGAAILVVPALCMMAISCLLILLSQNRAGRILAALAAVVFSLIVVPTSALAEIMLFLEYSAPFTLLLVYCFILFVALVIPPAGLEQKLSWALPGVGLCVVIFFTVAALLVPAYSPSAPRGLSIIHTADSKTGDYSFVAHTTDPLPSAMNDIAKYSYGSVVGSDREAYVAKAPSFDSSGVNMLIKQNEVVDGKRMLAIEISAPDSDIITGRVIGEEGVVKAMSLNGIARTGTRTNKFSCHGRNCRSLKLTLEIRSDVTNISLQLNGFRYGLGLEGQAMLSARPDWVLPRSWGDLRLISQTIELQ